MKSPAVKGSRWVGVIATIAVVFGLLTIISGGLTLFNTGVRQDAGNYVPFVLWFNFLAGFAYVIAGIGLWRRERWSIWLSFAIAFVTLIVFVAFGLQIWRGGSFEMRTVGAMGLRTLTWLAISAVAYAKLANTRHRVTA